MLTSTCTCSSFRALILNFLCNAVVVVSAVVVDAVAAVAAAAVAFTLFLALLLLSFECACIEA